MQRGIHALALQNAGGLLLNGVVAHRLNGALAVDGLAQRADDAAQEAVAHRDARALAAAGDQSAHADLFNVVEQHDAQTIGLHALHHALCAGVEGDDLAVNGFVHALDFHDAVGSGDDRAALAGLGSGLVVLCAGLHGGKVRGACGDGLQHVFCGVVDHLVAHLQHIAGDQLRLHADGELRIRAVLLFQLGTDALQRLLRRGAGAVQISLQRFSCACHRRPPLSAAGPPANARRPAASGCVPAPWRTRYGSGRRSVHRPDATCWRAPPRQLPCRLR